MRDHESPLLRKLIPETLEGDYNLFFKTQARSRLRSKI